MFFSAAKKVVVTVYPQRNHRKRAARRAVHLASGQRIITCSDDGSLRLWNLESGTQIGNGWRDKPDVHSIALSPNGKTVATGTLHGTVMLWDIETGKVTAKWKGHTAPVGSVSWSLDGARVVSGSDDGTARVWDVKSGEPVPGLNPIKTGHRLVHAVSYSPNATKIATGGFTESTIEIWDVKTGQLLSTIEVPSSVWSLAWTSDEKKLICGTGDALIRIFDTATWQQIAVLKGHTETVSAITLSQNDRLLASASHRTVHLWNLDTNLPVGVHHEATVFGAAFSADGKLLATGCDDKNVCAWDIHTVLKTAGLEDLLFMPDAPKDECNKSLLDADAMQSPAPHRLPSGFVDDAQNRVHTSATNSLHPHPSARRRRRGALTSSLASGARTLLSHLPLLFCRPQPNVDEATEL